MRLPPTKVICEPDPEHPGWNTWDVADQARFNAIAMGKLLIRCEGENTARLRMFPGHAHANLIGTVHGALIMGLIDVSLFGSPFMLRGGDAARAVTLEVHTQFIGAGELGEPLDAVTEILRETRRLIFMRGTVVQGESLIAAFSGTIRKPTSA
jgi:acyl-coenzyme A thioesterase PaaI-like protein